MSDVAERAKVSKSTVSHVINETRFVEEHTKQRVLRAIEELDYRPSRIARGLASQRTNTVGLLISDVGNPFYHQVILGVEDVALANDYSMFLFNANYDLDRSKKYIHSMLDRQVDGVMFMSSRLSVELLSELTDNQVPTVVLDWDEIRAEGVGTITVDFETGIREAVDHLIGLGHERFAHVCGPLDLWTACVRRDFFLDALAENGIDPSQVVIVEGNLRIDGGRQALIQLLEASPRPTAVFTANDLTALGVVWEAREHALRIPEDLSVVGLDDISLSAQSTPPLTTVALPCYEIGSTAMNMLLGLIHDPQLDREGRRKLMATSLIVRQSTAAPASG
jgi:DNA-binding LacI/PurR family transcriptional regulator